MSNILIFNETLSHKVSDDIKLLEYKFHEVDFKIHNNSPVDLNLTLADLETLVTGAKVNVQLPLCGNIGVSATSIRLGNLIPATYLTSTDYNALVRTKMYVLRNSGEPIHIGNGLWMYNCNHIRVYMHGDYDMESNDIIRFIFGLDTECTFSKPNLSELSNIMSERLVTEEAFTFNRIDVEDYTFGITNRGTFQSDKTYVVTRGLSVDYGDETIITQISDTHEYIFEFEVDKYMSDELDEPLEYTYLNKVYRTSK